MGTQEIMVRTFFIETHGCQMNEHDSEKVGSLLRHRGLIPVPAVDQADLYLLNTCSVREKAARKVYSRLGRLRRRKRNDPGFLIGVLGCVAQQEGAELAKKAPFVDFVVGTHRYHELPDVLDDLEAESPSRGQRRSTRVATSFLDEPTPVEMKVPDREGAFRAAVTVMEGCNKRCAFCIVPQTRGRERNRPSSLILDEVRRVAAAGAVEVQLLGQTVNSYRDPSRPGYGFAQLLADVAAVPGLKRIRFTSPHPRHFSDDVIAVIAGNSNICDQVHLPLQSGSNRILRRMRRQHDADWYRALIEKFRRCGRDIALSTDMIVGFPGESDADFEETILLVKFARYEQMFSFKYSPRPGTEAFPWDDDVPDLEKTQRLTMLQRLQREIQLEIHCDKYLGHVVEILVEGTARDGQRLFGRTKSNKIVNFFGVEEPGEFTQVRIVEAGPNSLLGEALVDCRLADAV
jgi:tRNA-2-methylthio-N6-dimethylallyladenosine synthase